MALLFEGADGLSLYRLTLVTVGEMVLEISMEWLLTMAGGIDGLFAFELYLIL